MHLLCGKSTSLEVISNINTTAAAINAMWGWSLVYCFLMVVYHHNKTEGFYSRLLILEFSNPSLKTVKLKSSQIIHV